MKRSSRSGVRGSLVLTASLLAGCSSGTPGSSGGSGGGNLSKVDACNLLSPDEIRQATGVPMKSGQNQDSNVVKQCEWDPQNDNTALTVGLDVRRFTDDDWQTLQVFPSAVAVSALGEGADRNSPTRGALDVKYHGYLVEIGIVNFTTRPQEQLDQDTDNLAKLVLSRL